MSVKFKRNPDMLTRRGDFDILVFWRPGSKDWAVQITPHVDADYFRHFSCPPEAAHFAGEFPTFESAAIHAAAVDVHSLEVRS